MLELNVEKVAIIGPGLLGGSVGLALRAGGYRGRITGMARSAETLAAARRMGCIDEGTEDLNAALQGAGLVILATPVSTLPDLLCRVAERIERAAIVTDVGSTKLDIVTAAQAAQRQGCPLRFIGSHPMAGKTEQGPEAAEADLFRGKPCILTPTGAEDPETVGVVDNLWRTFGMTILKMSAQEHDLQAAVVSHLPHLAAVMLIQTVERLGGWEVASTGLASTTRLASSNPPMRLDIIRANRAAILQSLEAFGRHLDTWRTALTRDDPKAILQMLQHARDLRDQWLSRRPDAGEPAAAEPGDGE